MNGIGRRYLVDPVHYRSVHHAEMHIILLFSIERMAFSQLRLNGDLKSRFHDDVGWMCKIGKVEGVALIQDIGIVEVNLSLVPCRVDTDGVAFHYNDSTAADLAVVALNSEAEANHNSIVHQSLTMYWEETTTGTV